MIEGTKNINFNEEWKGGKKGKVDDGRNGGKNL
jgi:hypothetical protein